jgi:hypothetical protein
MRASKQWIAAHTHEMVSCLWGVFQGRLWLVVYEVENLE